MITLINSVQAASTDSLTVAIDHSPPYSYIDEQGNPQGLLFDLALAVSEQLDVNIEGISCPWARCLKLVENGVVDLLVGVSKTPEREQLYHFIEPGFTVKSDLLRFYTLSTGPEIKHYEDLMTMSVGSVRGSRHFPQFDQDNTLHRIETPNVDRLLQLLLAKRIDTFVYAESTIAPILKRIDTENQIVASEYAVSISAESYLALSRKSPYSSLEKQLSNAMQSLQKSGDIKILLERYGLAE